MFAVVEVKEIEERLVTVIENLYAYAMTFFKFN